MFKKRVTPGKTYCVTAYCPIVVSSELNNTEVILVDTTEPGQYFFVAPTTSINSSISPNYILEVKGGGGGGSGSGESISGVGITFEKVDSFDSLPETGQLGTIYLVPNDDTENQYTEYVYIDDRYEIIGSKEFTMPDLSGYAVLNGNNTFTGNITVSGDIEGSTSIKAPKSFLYKGTELSDWFTNIQTNVLNTTDNKYVWLTKDSQTITGDIEVTGDVTSSGLAGQIYTVDTPSTLMCDVVYDLGVLNEDKDLSGISFPVNPTRIQTCEIWLETGDIGYSITWPSDAIYIALEKDAVFTGSLTPNKRYRYAIRAEGDGTLAITKAYEYSV